MNDERYVVGGWRRFMAPEGESRVIEYHQCGALLNGLVGELRMADDEVRRLRALAERAVNKWEGWVDDQWAGTSFYDDERAQIDAARAELDGKSNG